MNKKAQTGNFLMILPFTLAILTIAIGIGTGVYSFYGKDYDMRTVDAQLLAFKIKDCLLKNEINWSLQEDFYKTCSLNRKVVEESFYIEIKEKGESIPKLRIKNTDLCLLGDKNPEYPVCFPITVKKNDKEYFILAGSSQTIRREIV